MCFSAAASFSTGAVLIPAGVYCLREAARKDWRYLSLGAAPVFFTIQQFCEGIVWLEFARGTASPPRAAELSFLFFALAFWPFWLPFSIIWSDRTHRGWNGLLAAFGIMIGLSLYLPIVTQTNRFLHVTVSHHSIRYDLQVIPALRVVPELVSRAVYVAVIALPLLLCAERRLRFLGLALLVSSVVSQLAFWYAYFSVWCLFAALLSFYLCVVYHALPNRARRDAESRPAMDA
jgi:hypothetical protein